MSSLLLLFRCATGEAWQQVMMACVEGQPCDPRATKKGRNCGSNAAYSYFVSFIFFCSFLMLNLFVAVIMDNFDYLTRDSSILGAHHLDEFIRVWAEYDPNATGYIHFTEMYDMLRNMDPPLGFGNKCPSRLAYKKLIRMNMPITEGGKVNFTTTLFALIRENLNIKMRPAEEMDQADKELRMTLQKLWPLQARKIINKLMPLHNELNAGKLTVGKIYAGLLVHENWKTTRFGQKPGATTLSGTSLIARLMGAVRNNNTRASHASVEVGNLLDGGGKSANSNLMGANSSSGGNNGAGGSSSGGASGGVLTLSGGGDQTTAASATAAAAAGVATGGASLTSHLTPDPADRRSSFSFLRRASDRRRRKQKMQEFGAVEEETTIVSPKHHRSSYSSSSHHHHHSGHINQYNSAGGESHDSDRRDSYTRADNSAGSGIYHHHNQQHHRLLSQRGSLGGGQMTAGVGRHYSGDSGNMSMSQQQQHHHLQNRHTGSLDDEQQQFTPDELEQHRRRRSINDRLTDVVSDAVEFVREESFKRGRRSIRPQNKRRPEEDLDSEEMRSICSNSGNNSGNNNNNNNTNTNNHQQQVINRSPSYRRRRQLRKSPKRSVNSGASTMHQQQYYGGSQQFSQISGADASDSGSLSMDTVVRQNVRAPHLIDRSSNVYNDNTTNGVARRRAQTMRQLSTGGINSGDQAITDSRAGGGGGGGTNGNRIQQQISSIGSQRFSYPGTDSTAMVGTGHHTQGTQQAYQSQWQQHQHHRSTDGPSMPAYAGHPDNLRRGPEASVEDEARMMSDMLDGGGASTSGAMSNSGPGARSSGFVPPQNINLGSPSARLIPDERIIPPTVPVRGRRLPQIPGTNIIRSAADFLHSSFYGRDRASTSAGFAAAASLAVAAGSSGLGQLNSGAPKQQQEPLFPSVSDSPTTLTMEADQVVGMRGPASIVGGANQSSLHLDNSINFPQVSYSPTHSGRLMDQTAAAVTAPLLSMLDNQHQSSREPQPTKSDLLITEHGAINWRRPKQSDEDDWC